LDQLRLILSGNETGAALDLAALELARIQYPELEAEPFLAKLNEFAEQYSGMAPFNLSGQNFVRQFHDFFFDQLGFHGNIEDYYNPLNSFLNNVLERRTGIPITLSVVYMELARRLGRDVEGIGLPGHFVVRVTDAEFTSYVDVFDRGRLLTEDECLQKAAQLTGNHSLHPATALKPISKRLILIRMLNNLRGIYLSRNNFGKALQVLNLLIEAMPGNAEEYFVRGMVNVHLQRYPAALADLQEFLQMAPDSDHAKEARHQVEQLQQWRAQMN
jgi:regulator of sirC expression with transglutaminase-like and TPR domain